MKRVLHLVCTIFDGGGLPLSVWNIIRALRDYTNWKPTLLAAKYPQLKPLRDFEESCAVERHFLPIWQPLNGRFGLPLSYPPGFVSTLRRMAAKSDLIHIHGLWMFPSLVGCPVLRSMHKPYILAPHGTLEPWALSYKGLKKQLVLRLAERKNLNRATYLQATSDKEKNSFQRLNLLTRVAVIPNCLNPDAEVYFADNKPALQRFLKDINSKGKVVLFVSRLHPQKRVVELVQTFARLTFDHPEWRLIIAGDEDLPGYKQQVQATIHAANIGERVQLVGHLSGDALWQTYQAADLFVLPTRSENFGIVVVEALAAGVPVITTRGAPWNELETEGCGWCVDLNMDAVEQALNQAMALPESTRREMGQRGRELVRRRFTSKTIAHSLADLYDKVDQELL